MSSKSSPASITIDTNPFYKFVNIYIHIYTTIYIHTYMGNKSFDNVCTIMQCNLYSSLYNETNLWNTNNDREGNCC